LENFSRLLPKKDGSAIKEKTMNARELVEVGIKKKKISQETGSKIVKRLDIILADFKNSGKK
jgi:hypothetical protein